MIDKNPTTDNSETYMGMKKSDWEKLQKIEQKCREIYKNEGEEPMLNYLMDRLEEKYFRDFMLLQARMSGKRTSLYYLVLDVLMSAELKHAQRLRLMRH